MILAMDSVAVLGHEVRNLLATFVGFSELLLTHDWPRAQQREYLQTMRDEAVRVTRFLQELLDFEQLEVNGLTLKARPTDMSSLLDYAAVLAAHDPAHPVDLDCAPDLPAALIEPDRVQQVLANLIANARKFSPQGGPIRIRARVVRTQLEICVQDSGIGIPADALPHVFEKYYRATGPGHHGIRGSGLGLAICRIIIEAHGGRIWAESAGPGQGARFTFTLPLARVAALRRRPSLLATRDHAPLTSVSSSAWR
jgi:signal transduction histidine kinase